MAKKLYQFYWECGRQGSLEGLFIADEQEVEKSIGQEVYFGEVLGKHSEVYGDLKEGDISEIEIPEDVVSILESKLGKTISGYNPLVYLEGEEF